MREGDGGDVGVVGVDVGYDSSGDIGLLSLEGSSKGGGGSISDWDLDEAKETRIL